MNYCIIVRSYAFFFLRKKNKLDWTVEFYKVITSFALSISDSAYLTFCSSFSSSSALMSSGPRTAYSILRRLKKTLSSVRTLPHGLTAALAAMPRYGVIVCWSSAEDTGPPSVIPTPLPSSAPPALCLVIIVVVVVVMVFVGQPPAITALRRRACDMIRVSANPPSLLLLLSLFLFHHEDRPLITRRFIRDDGYLPFLFPISSLDPVSFADRLEENRRRKIRRNHVSSTITAVANCELRGETKKGEGTHVSEPLLYDTVDWSSIQATRHLGHALSKMRWR